MNQMITCECGELVKSSYIKSHITSKRHNDLLNGVKVPTYTLIENKKVKCECGVILRTDSKRQHEKSIQHISYMNTPEGEEYLVRKVISIGFNIFGTSYVKQTK